jgi:capsular exopolysaccharide synthesis family protein
MQRKRARGLAAPRDGERWISTVPNPLRLVQLDPFSPFAEALHAVAARIAHQQLRTGQAKVIGCLSALAGEGKTTVAANLAQLLAESGRSTVLLDWDLRRHALTDLLAPGAEQGFAEVIGGRALLADVLYTDAKSGLHMLPAPHGQNRVHAGALLGSRQTALLVQELRARYDYVVIDLPALSPVVDAQIVSYLLDTSIVIVEWGATDRAMIEECLTRADLDADRILGAVLNKVDTKTLRRYGPAGNSSYLPLVQPRQALRAPDVVGA